MKGDCLAPGDSVTIDYSKMPSRFFDIQKGEEVTDPKEIAECEAELNLIIKEEERLYKECQDAS